MTVSEFERPHYEQEEDEELLFLDYIMSVPFPSGFKPPTVMEGYDGTMDPTWIELLTLSSVRPFLLP